ncbi:MAG: HK97 family phage prohead protease [Cucumibacter sp.]
MKAEIAPDGSFAGYASLFGETDQAGDLVMPGAFRRSLARRAAGRVRMLFQHDPKEPIGVWTRIAENASGLFVEGRLIEGVGRAETLKTLITAGAVDGLSIGFRTVKATRNPADGVRRLWQIDLWEVSIVTFPMLDAARIGPRAMFSESRLARSLGAAIQALQT